jgi:hypothetical protein
LHQRQHILGAGLARPCNDACEQSGTDKPRNKSMNSHAPIAPVPSNAFAIAAPLGRSKAKGRIPPRLFRSIFGGGLANSTPRQSRHSGSPTGPREARPDDRLSDEPGISTLACTRFSRIEIPGSR